MYAQTILLVGTDPYFLQKAGFSLEKAGYTVQVAKSGQEALYIISDMKPVLVLLEWQIPDIDVLELISLLRKQPQLSRVPIIIRLLAENEQKNVDCLEAGADLCLNEPFRETVFIARIRAVLRRTQPIHSLVM